MKQTHSTIKLVDLTKNPDGWGNARGKEVGALLENYIQRHPTTDIFKVSFDRIQRTDASFSRESVVEIASRFRTKHAITIVDLDDDDLIENLEMAAVKKEQPLFLWQDDSWRLLGPSPTKGNTDLLNFILSAAEATASTAASALDLKLTNASTKLKQLWESGYIMRREELAPSGGIEFIYFRIK
jgi:hypothetical protein